jgi:hypothetical protein
MPSGQLEEATIIDVNNPGNVVRCMFRPKELAFSKQNTWTMSPVKGRNIPKPQFGGGGAMQLQMELFFDTTDNGIERATDVRAATKALWKMMLIAPQRRNPETRKGEPPKVQFQWGRMLSFTAVIQQINQRFTLFKPDGTPVRATLNVTFQQYTDEEYVPQNPTSAGSGGYRVHRVKEGDIIDVIAYQEYGDAKLWRLLADANNLEDPMRLRPGQILSIPSLI